MRVVRLVLKDFRNYAACRLEPAAGLNLVVGPNGHGKTNLLEAVWVLTGARSPRAADPALLIREGTEQARVEAVVHVEATQAQRQIELRLSRRAPRRSFLVNGKPARHALDALGMFLAVWVSPDAAETVRGEPQRRRQFLDVALAQLDPVFRDAAVRYARVLAQRNRLLAQLASGKGAGSLLEVLDDQLASIGSLLAVRRWSLLQELAPAAHELHARLAGEPGCRLLLAYVASPGPLPEPTQAAYEGLLRRRLRELRAAELARRVTLAGPHRDDVSITLDGVDVRRLGSRGQQRTVGLALHLALWACLAERAREAPVLLVDDAASELDEGRRRRLCQVLPAQAQVLLSATEAELLGLEPLRERAPAVWRVSGGRLELVSG